MGWESASFLLWKTRSVHVYPLVSRRFSKSEGETAGATAYAASQIAFFVSIYCSYLSELKDMNAPARLPFPTEQSHTRSRTKARKEACAELGQEKNREKEEVEQQRLLKIKTHHAVPAESPGLQATLS